jgi:hypothetical protein
VCSERRTGGGGDADADADTDADADSDADSDGDGDVDDLADAKETCEQYVRCVAATNPGALGLIQQQYAADGTCWTADADLCEGACVVGLQQSHQAFPAEAECPPCMADRHCEEPGLPACDRDARACVASGADGDADADADSDADGFVEGTCCEGEGDECRGAGRTCLSFGDELNPYFCSRICDPQDDDCAPTMYCIVWDGPTDGRCVFASDPYECHPVANRVTEPPRIE